MSFHRYSDLHHTHVWWSAAAVAALDDAMRTVPARRWLEIAAGLDDVRPISRCGSSTWS
jgi:hypothetical protein